MGNYNTTAQTKKSSGTAKAALATAIGAGVVAVSNANNNCGRGCNNGGFLNNILGFGNCNNDCYVDEKEFAWAQAFNASEARNAKIEAERYADGVALGVYEQLVAEAKEINASQNDGFRTLFEEIRKQDKELAEMKSDLRCLSVVNEKEHEAIVDGYKAGIQLEAERRACGDQTLKCYVDATFIPGTLKLDADDICPEVQRKCPDVQLVELVSAATQSAVAQVLSAKKSV